MLQVAEQKLLTIPWSLPCGVGKGRTMQEGDGHTAGSAKPTSDLQDCFNNRSHFYGRMIHHTCEHFQIYHEKEMKSEFHMLKYEQDFFLIQMA